LETAAGILNITVHELTREKINLFFILYIPILWQWFCHSHWLCCFTAS